MGERPWQCRWCAASSATLVLDLGTIPAADHFPAITDPVPDPFYPLRAVLCDMCRLTQLEHDPTSPDEPRGVEPQALIDQARAAVGDLVAAGLAMPGATVREFPSPHGGSWLGPLHEQGLHPAPARADLVVDSLGIMHEADQHAAVTKRAAALNPNGVLAIHFHSLATILRDGTWNALRHGHYAYYGLPVLAAMTAAAGLRPLGAWTYPLYGGTVMAAFTPTSSTRSAGPTPLARLSALETGENDAGVTDPAVLATLGDAVTHTTTQLRDYVHARKGQRIGAYAAASRAVPLLTAAGLTATDIFAVADASPTKWGRALPGTRIPIISPDALTRARPDHVLLFVPDLLAEARAAVPTGTWAVVGASIHEIGAP